MNEGYKSRAFALNPKPKKKKREEFKVNDFVSSVKFIEASSSDEEDPWKKARSKAARELLESENPTENATERKVRLARVNKKVERYKFTNRRMPSELAQSSNREPDDLIKEITQY